MSRLLGLWSVTATAVVGVACPAADTAPDAGTWEKVAGVYTNYEYSSDAWILEPDCVVSHFDNHAEFFAGLLGPEVIDAERPRFTYRWQEDQRTKERNGVVTSEFPATDFPLIDAYLDRIGKRPWWLRVGLIWTLKKSIPASADDDLVNDTDLLIADTSARFEDLPDTRSRDNMLYLTYYEFEEGKAAYAFVAWLTQTYGLDAAVSAFRALHVDPAAMTSEPLFDGASLAEVLETWRATAPPTFDLRMRGGNYFTCDQPPLPLEPGDLESVSGEFLCGSEPGDVFFGRIPWRPARSAVQVLEVDRETTIVATATVTARTRLQVESCYWGPAPTGEQLWDETGATPDEPESVQVSFTARPGVYLLRLTQREPGHKSERVRPYELEIEAFPFIRAPLEAATAVSRATRATPMRAPRVGMAVGRPLGVALVAVAASGCLGAPPAERRPPTQQDVDGGGDDDTDSDDDTGSFGSPDDELRACVVGWWLSEPGLSCSVHIWCNEPPDGGPEPPAQCEDAECHIRFIQGYFLPDDWRRLIVLQATQAMTWSAVSVEHDVWRIEDGGVAIFENGAAAVTECDDERLSKDLTLIGYRGEGPFVESLSSAWDAGIRVDVSYGP